MKRTNLKAKTVKQRVFWFTFALIIGSWISLKIVLPALPGLSDVFKCNPHGIKISVSLYLILFAFSQPVWGAITQKFGCRKALLYSFLIAFAGSMIAMLSNDLPMYIIGRSLEGIGMGSASPVGRTMFTKVFEKKELARRIGIASGVAAAMPAVSPIVGGFLMEWIDWRAIFGLLLLFTIAYLIAVHFGLPDLDDKSDKKETVTVGNLLKIYSSILRSPRFWGYTMTYGVIIGGLLGYYSAMPFWYHTQLGISTHIFSFIAIPTVGMYIIGITIAGIMVKKNEIEEILFYGVLLTFIVAVIAIGMVAVGLNGIVIIVIIMSLYGFAGGLIVPNSNAGVLTAFKKVAAPASALVGLVIFTTSSITSYITMNMNIKESLWPLVIYICALSLISLVIGYFWVRRLFLADRKSRI